MRDVYRRADIARFTALSGLPVTVVLTAIVALAGVRAPSGPLVIGGVVGACAAAATFGGLRRRGWNPGDRLAPAARTRSKTLARQAVSLLALAVFVAALSGADHTGWWLLPGVSAIVTVSGALSWWHLSLWERRHPGAIPVTDYGWWKADSYVMVAGATPPPRRMPGWAAWLVGDR